MTPVNIDCGIARLYTRALSRRHDTTEAMQLVADVGVCLRRLHPRGAARRKEKANE